MSIQHHLQDQVVDADPWTLFCAECSQKMRVMRATPAQEGRKHAPTNASAVTAKASTWPLTAGSRDRSGFAGFHAKPEIVHDNDRSVTFAAKSHDQARDNPDDKGPSGSPSAIRA